MLIPPVAQGPGGRQVVGDVGARGVQSSVPAATATLWPLTSTQGNLSGSHHQSQATPPLAAAPAPAHNQGLDRFELYSLFPGGGGGSYVAATPPAATPARTFHATTHKAERTVSESMFSAAVGVSGYTWGAPTPPPGSPYSPVPVTQLELLAKNLASLTPHHTQQPLNLQGIGVNVGTSLHQHTTQHTLNLAGLHHLHHGGLHQGTFSPQLSLVTAGTPTLTLNSFTTPNSQGNIVQPSAGVLLHEYQSSNGQNNVTACTPSTVSVSTLPSAASACSVSTMMVQDGQNANTFLQSTMKKRESFVTAQAQIKVENTTTTRQSCVCKSSNVTGKTKIIHSEAGCSRTLPVVSSWNNQDLSTHTSATSIIKREPLTATVPCQVAEVSTSLHATTTEVKIEPLSQKTENGMVSTAAGTGIPVGIAVARQRLQHQETSSTSMRNVSLSHHTSHHASYHHFQPDSLGPTTAMTMGGATLVHCGSSGDDRTSHIAIPTGNALAPTINAALSSTLNSATIANIGATQHNSNTGTATWPPTLWQYPTAAMPALEPVGFPQLSVGLQGGLQLVRDPSTGHLLLIHGADGLNTAEQMQQAVVWPNYQNHNGHSIGTQPLLLPPPPPPSLQLLNDMNGTRLVLTDNKRKSQNNNVPIVKIEADCPSPHTSIIESSKALQTVTTMSSPLVPESPLLTTLHYYPHAPALVQISQSESTQCRTQHRNAFISKATSPVSCLTPPPEIATSQSLDTPENLPIVVQDASNQTDAPEIDEEHAQLPENLVKPEQLLSNQQLSGSINIVSSTGKPQVSLQPYNLVTKIDKSENTINIPCLKSENSTSNCLKSDAVSSVDQTIESVISCRSNKPEIDDEESLNVDDNSEDRSTPRVRSKMIEITEENCDSFHENLEFFGRRRDPVEQHRRPVFSEELFNKEKILEEKRRKELLNNDSDADEFQGFHEIQKEEISIVDDKNCSQDISSSLEIHGKILHDVEASLSVEKAEKNQEVDPSVSSNDTNKQTQFSVKSFDMPSIDCEDDEQMNIKDVKKDSIEVKNSESEKNELNTHGNIEKINDKKNMTEKLHPGIENVIEKLKKNAAAALQDQDSSTVNNEKDKVLKHSEIPRAVVHCQPRRLENGLKKHILRSCELELNLENKKNHKELLSINPVTSSENNNDCNSSNQNFKSLEIEINSMQNNKSPTKIIENSPPKKYSIDFINSSPSNSTITSKELEKSKNLINSSNIKTRVDLSGLELLSNSIAELEHIKSVEDNSSLSEREISPSKETLEVIQNENNNNEVDSPLGLLCALAEQRFMEEVADKVQPDNSEEVSHAGRLLLSLGKITPDKLNKRKHSCDDVELKFYKNSRKNINFSGTNISNRTREFEDGDADDDFTDSESEMSKKNNRNKLNNRQAKSNDVFKGDENSLRQDVDEKNPTNDGKQKELLKLSAEKDEKINSDYETELEDSPIKLQDEKYNTQFNDLSIENSKCNLNLTKVMNEPQSHIKLLDSIPSISLAVPSVSFTKSTCQNDEKLSGSQDEETSSPLTSPTSSSKKRKVGRPKKCTSESSRNFTQTLITKTSKGDSSTNYVVSTKNRCKFNGKTGYTPLPFKSNIKNAKRLKKSHKMKKLNINSSKQTPLHNKNVISSIIAEKAKLSQETKLEKQIVKLKPKLKAEVKLKTWNADQDTEWNYTIENPINSSSSLIKNDEVSVLNQGTIKINNKQDYDMKKLKKKKRKSMSSSPSRRRTFENDERYRKESKRRKSSDCKDCKECLKAAKFEKEKADTINNKCKITAQHLEIDQMRVLTAMGGLFYAGRLSAVQAPDIYSITLDGERGNRPHIHSREEILKDAIVEVCPTSTKELPPGTRLCAYWSQQYRCLYPGTSVEASEPDSELDDKFVSVEFDDGDSGRIALDDIRLLQPNYPVVEYDPNPLLTLGKRRRQVSSSTDDKRPSDNSLQSPNFQSTDLPSSSHQVSLSSKKLFNIDAAKSLEEYRERKRLKKRRRDKLKRLHEAQEGKRKHKKHKCCEEHRKHRHRKHRKHKHRHNHHASFSEGSHVSGGESCSGQKSDEENIAKAIVTPLGKNKIQNSNIEDLKIEEIQPSVDTTEIETIEKIDKTKKVEKKGKAKECQESVESRSKMAAFLPARQLWGWSGKGYRRPGAKGRAKKQFFKAIQRGGEAIQIGDSAVFLSTGRPDRPYIGRIESMWETSSSNMIVKVKWFYHPEETVGCPTNLKYPGALFESPHMDENDVQTISHKCEVLPLADYTEKLGKEPHRYLTIYDNNDIYYLAGYYDPTTYLLTMQSGVV